VIELLIAAAALAAGVCALAWWAQERLIFFPQPLASTAHLPARAIPLDVVAADGSRLAGFLVPGATAPAPAVIYFGGNAEEASWVLTEARWPGDYTLAAVNYRGYGKSEGEPGERALTEDALAIYDAIARRPDVDRNGSSSTAAASAPPLRLTSRRHGLSRASSSRRRSTASSPSAVSITRGCRSRCCCGIASTRRRSRAAFTRRCSHWSVMPIRSFHRRARARCSTRGRARRRGR
jgi:hypothetical protein